MAAPARRTSIRPSSISPSSSSPRLPVIRLPSAGGRLGACLSFADRTALPLASSLSLFALRLLLACRALSLCPLLQGLPSPFPRSSAPSFLPSSSSSSFPFSPFSFISPFASLAASGFSMMRSSLRPSDPAVSPAIERVNAELFTLTYGAIVRQLLTDYEEIEEVNKQLDTMGYNIGARLIDDFLAKANITKCSDFRETADVIAKVGFKMFLNVTATVANWSADNMECSLILEDNPLVDFVELPETCQGLCYCNILCGVLRGALEMVSMRTEVRFVKDMLRGDDVFEIRMKLLEQLPEEYPYKNDE